MTGRLIGFVGPSGVGKDSVMAALAARRDDVVCARRAITRPADAGGEAHEALSEDEFLRRAEAGAFLLHWRAHGLGYGVPEDVLAPLDQGRHVLVNLSRGVLAEAQRRLPGFIAVALTARPEVLAKRLAARGRESAKDIAARLARRGDPAPEGVAVIEIDNSGALTDTVAALEARLWPQKTPEQRKAPA